MKWGGEGGVDGRGSSRVGGGKGVAILLEKIVLQKPGNMTAVVIVDFHAFIFTIFTLFKGYSGRKPRMITCTQQEKPYFGIFPFKRPSKS